MLLVYDHYFQIFEGLSHIYKTCKIKEGQESLVCCSPWGCKESDTAEWLNNTTYKNEFCLANTYVQAFVNQKVT